MTAEELCRGIFINKYVCLLIKNGLIPLLRQYYKKNWTVYFQRCFFETPSAVTHFVALIGCRSIQSRPEAFLSVPVGDAPWK